MMSEIKKVSERTKEAIKRKSAFGLPDRPSELGMKPEDIKRAFWQPVVDISYSAIAEIDRVVEEANALIEETVSDLAKVAKSGKYEDLTGAPALAGVATSGKYEDLSGKPDLSNYAHTEDITNAINADHRVGSLYFGIGNISPATYYGGSWEELPNGTFLMAAGSGGAAGTIGGSNTHTHGAGSLVSCFYHPGNDTTYDHLIAQTRAIDPPAYSNSVVTDTYVWDKKIAEFWIKWNNGVWELNNGIAVAGNTAGADSRPQYMSVHIWRRVA